MSEQDLGNFLFSCFLFPPSENDRPSAPTAHMHMVSHSRRQRTPSPIGQSSYSMNYGEKCHFRCVLTTAAVAATLPRLKATA